MATKQYKAYDFYGKKVFVEDTFKVHFDKEKKTLMVVEQHYTDFNAVLIYNDDQSIQILPRWQTNFTFKEDSLYIYREG